MALAVLTLAEAIMFGTGYGGIVFAAAMLPMFGIRCRNCDTPIHDHRIAGYVKDFDEGGVLADCPVCHEEMLPARYPTGSA